MTSPVLRAMRAYPFLRLREARARVAAAGIELIDFGMGEPREQTPDFIRAALRDALEPRSTYPPAEGLAAYREAVADWCARRFPGGPPLDPDTEVLPTLGSKEAVFALAEVVCDVPGGRDVVAVTTPGYPVPARGAAFAGATVVELPLLERRGFLPDLDAVPWDRLAILWLNYPNNPTAAVAPLSLYEEAAARCRECGAVLASDEAYSELWFGDAPPAGVLDLADRSNVLAFNTLSKRSSMPGYRIGFVAGDPELVALHRRYRPMTGTAPQEFVQRAGIAAWRDELHVAEVRALYGRKRALLLDALGAAGLRVAGAEATFFLWVEVPGDAEAWAQALLARGVVVSPGSFFGPGGEGFIRFALVPELGACERAAAIVADRAGWAP